MNKLLDRIDLLQKIDTHILLQKEGGVTVVARKFKISRRRLYTYFTILKDLGAPIEYNRENRRLQYKTNFRIQIRVNTFPQIEAPKELYKKIKDITLKKIILFNKIDEYIFTKTSGPTTGFYKKLKLRDNRECGNTLYEFKNMGADFYFDRTDLTYRYAKRKRFNFILEVLPFKIPE